MLLSTLQSTGQSFGTKSYPVQNVNSGEGEKACPGLRWASTQELITLHGFYCNSEDCVRSGGP